MTARTRDGFVLAAAVCALAAIGVAQHQAQRAQATRSTFSSYDRGRNGYRALYAVLERAGVTVRRLRRPLSTLGASGTLLVSDNAGDPAPIAFDTNDRDALRRFVTGGGRLVVLASGFRGDRDVVPQISRTRTASVDVALPSAALRAAGGVVSVRTPAQSAFVPSSRETSVLVARDRNRVTIAYRVGRGVVIASTSPASLSNLRLLERDNVRFAYAILAGHGPVTFDEYAHGYNDDETLWQAIPQSMQWAVGLAIAIVMVAAIGANVPFAPPVPLDGPDERNGVAYVDAMASLLRRGRARADAIASLARSAAHAPRGRRDAAKREFERLAASAPTDAALLRAASLEFQLRKERS